MTTSATTVRTRADREASLRIALGCAMAAHDRDWERLCALLEPLSRVELMPVTRLLAGLVTRAESREHLAHLALRAAGPIPERSAP